MDLDTSGPDYVRKLVAVVVAKYPTQAAPRLSEPHLLYLRSYGTCSSSAAFRFARSPRRS